MMQRRGFTLIEVLVSIVLTAVVSVLVYGVVQAARDTQARIARDQQGLQSSLAMRLLLESALSGAQTNFLAADTMFILENRTSSRGVPEDRLTFVASGDFPPLSPNADWVVTLEPTARGLRFSGGPMGVRTPNRLLALLPGVTGLEVRVRHPDLGPNWSEEWASHAILPSAVELTYWNENGKIGVPLTVQLALGQVP
jgi:prepilin-type N-terminal cleavage/methylation domain-containing protein